MADWWPSLSDGWGPAWDYFLPWGHPEAGRKDLGNTCLPSDMPVSEHIGH